MEKEYEITYEGGYTVTVTVTAESEEEALELVQEPVVIQYCGNGGCEHLIGVDGYDPGKPTIENHGMMEQSEIYEK